jgi:NAD(P)-dependent dehydrogenase (short-subunit alcohol dehydrogenase family)
VDLSGRVVVVTGAGHDLGRAYAEALGAAGAAVVVNDADADAAHEVAARISDLGGAAIAAPGTVGPTEVAEGLVDRAIAAYGRLDVLVTGADVQRDCLLWRLSDEDFDTAISVTVRGTFTCVRAAARRIHDQGSGGRIIAIGSLAGQRGKEGQTTGSAVRAAIVGMVRTWSMECARAGITVNAVIPMAATAMPPPESPVTAWRPERVRESPWADPGQGCSTPEAVAGLVVFLASPESGGVTGQAIGISDHKLSLWSHPEEVIAAYCKDGWSPQAVAQAWPAIAVRAQLVGTPPTGAPPERRWPRGR